MIIVSSCELNFLILQVSRCPLGCIQVLFVIFWPNFVYIINLVVQCMFPHIVVTVKWHYYLKCSTCFFQTWSIKLFTRLKARYTIVSTIRYNISKIILVCCACFVQFDNGFWLNISLTVLATQDKSLTNGNHPKPKSYHKKCFIE